MSGSLRAAGRITASAAGLLCLQAALAQEASETSASLDAAGAPKPIDFLLTREELRRIAMRGVFAPGATGPTDDDAVVVRGARELLPMRDISQEPWVGPHAPIWGLLHPKDAWRIFLPIPPKDTTKD